jgi:hypothetical protein
MKLLFTIAFVAIAVFSGCSGGDTCARGDWCACQGGNECDQHCDGDGNGCRLFCYDAKRCGSVCGDECNIDCQNATACDAECGNDCTLNCNGNISCDTSCGANCSYTCWETQSCSIKAGPGSMISCTATESCMVECLGDCRVYCVDQVDHCEVKCPQGAAPISCPDGMIACGSC